MSTANEFGNAGETEKALEEAYEMIRQLTKQRDLLLDENATLRNALLQMHKQKTNAIYTNTGSVGT